MNALCVIKTSIFTLLLVTGLLLLTPIKALSMTNAIEQHQEGDMKVFQGDSNLQTSIRMTLITGDTLVAKSLATTNGMRLYSANDNQPSEFVTFVRLGFRYVIPQIAKEFVDLGLIDVELFNLTKLYKTRLDDSRSNNFRILVKYYKNHHPAEIDGAESSVLFKQINTQLVTVNKQAARQVWNNIVSNQAIQKVWLDEPMQNH